MFLKKVSSEIIHENPWWNYKCDKIIRPDGSEGEYCYVETHGNVIVIPILDDGRLVLVKQHRYLAQKYSLEFPGGGKEKNESPENAARRELLEESGYEAKKITKIGVFEPCVGVVKDLSHIFIAKNLSLIQEPKRDAFEETEVVMCSVNDFENMIKEGKIWDGQVLAAWVMVKYFI